MRAGEMPEPAGKGIIDVRNSLWEMISSSPKVAAVLGSDEHNYQRMLIDRNTPVGLPEKDDRNGDQILDEDALSPNPRFVYPTWFLISGGAGAPYYTQQDAPWRGAVKSFTAQANYLLFRTAGKRMSLEVYAPNGQLLDRVEDLMAVRAGARTTHPAGK
jgi:hypothetical protein